MSSGHAMVEEAQAEQIYVRPKKAEKKKSNFIARWFFKSLKEAADEEKSQNEIGVIQMKEARRLKEAVGSQESINVDPMYLKVWKANGGYIVETRTPNNSRETRNLIGESSSNTKLHIITNDKDIGQEIGKIITLENLRA